MFKITIFKIKSRVAETRILHSKKNEAYFIYNLKQIISVHLNSVKTCNKKD